MIEEFVGETGVAVARGASPAHPSKEKPQITQMDADKSSSILTIFEGHASRVPDATCEVG